MPRITRHNSAGNNRSRKVRTSRTKALTVYVTTDTHRADPSAPDSALFLFSTVPAKLASLATQINADLPHVFLHTGDAIERGDGFYGASDTPDNNFGHFRSELWDVINPAVVKLWSPGNHDYSITQDSGHTLNDTIARCMGQSGDPVVAGGRFNKSVSVTGNGVSVRFIVLDVLQERDGTPAGGPYTEQAPVDKGSLSDAQKAWLTSELAASAENLIVIASHVGAHDTRDSTNAWGVSTDRQDFVNIVAAEKAARPARKIVGLFGHNHVTTLRAYTNLPGFPGWLSPCVIQGNPSWFAKFHIYADGTILTDTGIVRG